MTKTIFALVTAGILGAVMVPTGAHAFDTKATQMRTDTRQDQARLTKERQLLRRDVRMGKTVQAARLRREINADERAISRAKRGMEQAPTTRGMQPGQTTTQPTQPSGQRSQTNMPNPGTSQGQQNQ